MIHNGTEALLISLIAIIVLILIEILLSKQRNRFVGMIPIIIIAILMVSLGFYTKSMQEQSHIIIERLPFNDNSSIEMKLKISSKGQVVAYSDLQIKNSKNELIDVAPVYASLKSDYRYKNIGSTLIEKYGLTGESERIERVNSKNVQFGEYTIRSRTFFIAAIVLNLPLIAIYSLCRLQLRNRRISEELRLLRIQMSL
ncbi:MAG: hypothetical protein ACLRWH_05080 [Emergencia sp.]